MIRRYVIPSVLCVSLLSACSGVSSSQNTAELSQADFMVQNGQYQEAVQIYKTFADMPSEKQNYYRLLAADASIRANDMKMAAHYLALINVNYLNQEQSQHFMLLKAQMDLNQGNAEAALTKLKTIQFELLNTSTKIAYYQSLAFAYSLTGNALKSAQTLVESEPLLQTQAQRTQHYTQILSVLSALSEEELQSKQPSSNPELKGWMALERVFKQGGADLNDNIAKWRATHPNHYANSVFLSRYL